MDILDNVMYATFNSPLVGGNNIESDYFPNIVWPGPLLTNPGPPPPIIPVYSYSLPSKFNYCTSEDPRYIERGLERHWYDVDNQAIYNTGGTQFSSFQYSSTYHMIYAYLIENTRIFQIFERFIDKYLNDEDLGISNNIQTFNWITNTERLFFKADTPKTTNLRSMIRPSSDASRRNAYNRMFGMDLAFGDIQSQSNTVNYHKARAANQQFIVLFERYLSEVWQGYINARNTSGANTSDVNILVELAQQLQEMLAARRGDTGANTYAHQNLSREEFSSVLISNWFAFIISYDSPIVNHMSCQSSTIGERLMKIGDKVGIPAHRKCQSLFEMAGSASTILLAVEAGGLLDNAAWVQAMLSSLNPTAPPSIQVPYMNAFLTVINNWEKATGHKIKDPAANITGTVRVQQNGVAQNGVRPQPLMN